MAFKTFFDDQEATIQFGYHIAVYLQQNIDSQDVRGAVDYEIWKGWARTFSDAFAAVASYMHHTPQPRIFAPPRELERKFHKDGEWRLFYGAKQRELCVMEYALMCILHPYDSYIYGYKLTKAFAGYEPKAANQQIQPSAATAVKRMADFWSGYYFGNTIDDWRA